MQLLGTNGRDKLATEVMTAHLPAETVEFLLSVRDPYACDAYGRPRESPPLPVPEAVREAVESRASPRLGRSIVGDTGPAAGSNAWAIAAEASVEGEALVAGDLHLPLTVPSTWYRATVAVNGRELHGVFAPGLPMAVIGSNGRVAWSVTRLVADTADLVEVEVGYGGDKYRDGTAWRPLDRYAERVLVRDGEPVEVGVRRTRWGPIVGASPLDERRELALHWTLGDRRAFDLRLARLFAATSVRTACDIVNRAGGPTLTVVLADTDGEIAMTVAGRVPDRAGSGTGRTCRQLPDGRHAPLPWSRLLPPERLPRVIGSPTGMLISANNLTPEHGEALVGGNGFGGHRAQRIAVLLSFPDSRAVSGSAIAQMDVEVCVLAFYRDLILDELRSEPGTAACGQDDDEVSLCRRAIELWDGTADPGSRGVAVLTIFRELMREELFGPVLADCLAGDPNFTYRWHNHEAPLRAMLVARLRPRPYADFTAFVRKQLVVTARMLQASGTNPDEPWGAVNRLHVKHPLSSVDPRLAALGDLPTASLRGHQESVCVGAPAFGQSVRLVVAPARLDSGLIALAGGQSGHPGDPWSACALADWLAGRFAPLRPGPAVASARLVPIRSAGTGSWTIAGGVVGGEKNRRTRPSGSWRVWPQYHEGGEPEVGRRSVPEHTTDRAHDTGLTDSDGTSQGRGMHA